MTMQTGLLNKTTEIVSTLSTARELAGRLPASAYRAGADQNGGGSIGAHLRHVLDHYLSFLGGLASGRIDYDVRRRGSVVEQDPGAAIETIDRICARRVGVAVAPTFGMAPATLDYLASLAVREAG